MGFIFYFLLYICFPKAYKVLATFCSPNLMSIMPSIVWTLLFFSSKHSSLNLHHTLKNCMWYTVILQNSSDFSTNQMGSLHGNVIGVITTTSFKPSDGGTSLCNSLGFHYGIWLDTLEEKGISNDFHSALSTIMAHNHMSQSHSVDIDSF